MTATTERPTGRMLLVDDIAERLTCSRRTVLRHAKAGLLPRPVRVGGMTRWRADDIDNWIAAGCPAPTAAAATA